MSSLPTALFVRDVDDEMMMNLLELTGFADDEFSGIYKPHIENKGPNKIVRFYSRENAELFLELILSTDAHSLDWYID